MTTKSYIAYKNMAEGFSDVSETVKTVEKIAASAVHFLKRKVSALDSYAAETEKILARLSLFLREEDSPFFREGKGGGATLVVLTGDKGLVGGLWHKVVNAVLNGAERYQSLVVVGAKGEGYLKEEGAPPAKLFPGFSDAPEEAEIKSVADYVLGEFGKGRFSRVDIAYPGFVSLAEQEAVLVPFLPFGFFPEEKGRVSAARKSPAGFPIFEPSKKEFFDRLLLKYIGVFFRKIAMETKLSELSARTVAMEHASAKTDELIKKLKINCAKERRRRITRGQLENFAAREASERRERI